MNKKSRGSGAKGYIITLVLIFVAVFLLGYWFYGLEQTLHTVLSYTIGFTASALLVLLVGFLLARKNMSRWLKKLLR